MLSESTFANFSYGKLRMMKRAVKRPKKPPYKVQVLDRAINILEFIGKQSTGEAGLPELSAAMKLHKTTTRRIAHVLESRGLLRRGLDSNRYRLGLRLYDLGCQALDHVNIRDEARPLMTRVAFDVGETVHLALLDRAEVLYIERIEAQRSLTMGSKLGARNPVYCTSLGKAILANLPESEVDQNPLKLPYGGEDQEHNYECACPETGVGNDTRARLRDR